MKNLNRLDRILAAEGKFSAFRVVQSPECTQACFEQLGLDNLDSGDVVIEAYYSSVNYKDALAATNSGRVVRRFPCVLGVDVAGVVVHSEDARFEVGHQVVVTGYGMGVDHDGGFAEFVRVPADWIVPLPQGMTLYESMAIGTAGFTAALAIHRLEQNDLHPELGEVIVTGASGGVGSLGIMMLSQLGYEVVALTGKSQEGEYLNSLGAKRILMRGEVVMGVRPLEKGQWAGALDSVGGATLSWLTRSMQQNGVIASIGHAGGTELVTSVMPFILRGVRLIGIDSAATVMSVRRQIWQRLATDLRPKSIDTIADKVAFSDLAEVCQSILQSGHHGRKVVAIKDEI